MTPGITTFPERSQVKDLAGEAARPLTEQPAGRRTEPAGEELTLIALANVLLRRRALVLWLPAVLFAAAVVYRQLQPRSYTSMASFMPQRSAAQKNSLGGLAAQFGVVVPGAQTGESPAFYSDLVRSRAILEPLLDTKFRVQTNGVVRTTTIADVYELKGAPAQRREAALRRLRDDIDVSTSRLTDIVKLSVSARSPDLAQQVAARVITLVNQFNLETRQSQAREERRFVEGRLAAARTDLRQAENRLQEFLQRNRGGFSRAPELLLTNDRLERDVLWRQQVFTSLAQAYEEARIDEVRNNPVITVVDAPVVPVRADGRGTVKWALMGVMLGVVLAVVIAFATEFSRNARLRPEGEFREFERLRTELLRDFRRPWRIVRLRRSVR